MIIFVLEKPPVQNSPCEPTSATVVPLIASIPKYENWNHTRTQ